MPLGGRDLLLIIRASDRASGIIRGISGAIGTLGTATRMTAQQSLMLGGALTAVGIGIAALGAKAVGFFLDAADAAKEYNRQSALTLTQVDELGVTLDQIKEIGRDVASAIPAPFEEMQAALFDIFSSMEVSAADAGTILEGFAKAAVAGQVDVQTAGRATIAIMNAWQLGADDLDRVLDVQFQLVRKGVGTYEEFATAIGRAIPAARAAGQSIESLAAMMAFLTRNGLSADQAATSAARALDLLKKPDVISNLHNIGVEVVDAAGNFRQMNDIVRDLSVVWGDLTAPQRAAAFKEVFGTSTAQARRFFDLALTDSAALDALFGDMTNSAGALTDAFGIMSEQGAAQAQLLANNWAILKTEIGDVVLPVLVKLTQIGIKIIRWFRDLDPNVQKAIITFAAVAAVMTLLLGIVTALAGAILIIHGVFLLLNTSLAALSFSFAAILIPLALMAAAAYLIYRNWGTIKKIAKIVWEYVNDIVQDVWEFLQRFWDWVTGAFVDIWHGVKEGAETAWNGVTTAISTAWTFIQDVASRIVDIGHTIADGFSTGVSAITSFFVAVGERIGALGAAIGRVPLFQEFIATVKHVAGQAKEAVQRIIQVFQFLWEALQPVFGFIGSTSVTVFNGFSAVVKTAFNVISTVVRGFVMTFQAVAPVVVTVVKAVAEVIGGLVKIFADVFGIIHSFLGARWAMIKAIFSVALRFIRRIVETALDFIVQLWENFGDNILRAVRAAWNLITDIVKGVIDILRGIIRTFLAVIRGDWSTAWEGVKQVLAGVWDIITGIVRFAVDSVLNVIDGFFSLLHQIWQTGWQLLKDIFASAWDLLYEGVKAGIEAVIEFFVELPGRILDLLKDLGSLLWAHGEALIKGLWNGIVAAAVAVWNWFTALPGAIAAFFSTAASWLLQKGIDIIHGILEGITTAAEWVWAWLGGVKDRVVGFFSDAVSWLLQKGWDTINGLWKGLVDAAVTVWDWFGRIKDKILGFFAGAISWLYNAGSDIVQGLINGLTGRSADFARAVTNLSVAAHNATGQVNGIGSPSKVYMYFGRMMTAGLIEGINEGIPEVKNAMMNLHKATGFGTDVSFGNMPTNNMPLLSGGGGNNVTISPGAFSIVINDATNPEAVKAVVHDELQEFTRELITSKGSN